MALTYNIAVAMVQHHQSSSTDPMNELFAAIFSVTLAFKKFLYSCTSTFAINNKNWLSSYTADRKTVTIRDRYSQQCVLLLQIDR